MKTRTKAVGVLTTVVAGTLLLTATPAQAAPVAPKTIDKTLISLGYKPNARVGIISVFKHESNSDPAAGSLFNTNRGFGLFQWTARRHVDLLTYLNQKHSSAVNTTNQVKFFDFEMQKRVINDKNSKLVNITIKQAVNKASSPARVEWIICKYNLQRPFC